MTHQTPRLTRHARQRCSELGVSTKKAKAVVRNRISTYPGNPAHGNNGLVVMSDDPEIAVIWDPGTNHILTVLPRVQDPYVRTPTGYEVKP